MTEKIYSSRSAALTYQTCKRKRYYTNHYGNHGLSPEATDLFLETGTCIHRGMQNLLEHCRLEHPDGSFEEQCINQSVEIAINLFREDISKASISLRVGEETNQDFIIAEHECLIEGLIRAFSIKRLPFLLEEYEILSVERDEIFPEFSDVVNWQFRTDAEFLTKDYSLGVVICSIKSASEFAENTIRNLLTDMQGNSEWVAVQARLLREFNQYVTEINLGTRVETSYDKYFKWCNENKQKPKVYAVQYEYLITGAYRDDDKTGLRKRKSFLVHPYKLNKLATLNVFSGIQTSAPTDYKWKVGAGRQPKGWERINIWEDVGVNNWINMLAQGLVQPEEGNPLDEIIITSDLIFRDIGNGKKLEEWFVSTKYQEEQIAANLAILNQQADFCRKSNDWTLFEKTLMQLFPKETQTCWNYYGDHCAFTKICHEGYNLSDLIAANIYVNRIPHHQPEKLYHIERGFIEK